MADAYQAGVGATRDPVNEALPGGKLFTLGLQHVLVVSCRTRSIR